MPNLPQDVERYVQEGLDTRMDESKAWAVAWSRYCKYKNPGSSHCKQDEYFHGNGVQKKANAGPFVGKGWGEHSEWLRQSRNAPLKQVDAQRAREIIQQAKAMTQYGPWSDNIDRVLSQGERRFISQFWDTLPSNTSFTDALEELAKERKMAFQTWNSPHESPAGVRYPKSVWDNATRSHAVFRWATPAANMDGTFPEPWRVADKGAALRFLKGIVPDGYEDLYVDYESDLHRGRLQIWVGLRDNRDRVAHAERLAYLADLLADEGYPVNDKVTSGRLWLLDDVAKDVLRTKRASEEAETWALVSPDGYLFGIADMPNAKSKSYWRYSVDDDHLDEAELVKLVNLPPNLHDRVQKNDFDDGYDAWHTVSKYKKGPTKRLANKVVTTIKGQLPQPRDPAAREMALNPPSGGGKHKNKQDYQRGKARNPKHKKPLDRDASQPLSLRRDYGTLEEAWGDVIYDA